jgi:hypothetical protein
VNGPVHFVGDTRFVVLENQQLLVRVAADHLRSCGRSMRKRSRERW